MLWHKVQGAGGVGGGGGSIEYIGSVTASIPRGDTGWNTPGEGPDILSIAETGDLVVIAFSFDSGRDGSWNWEGMPFSAVNNATAALTAIGAYVGYRFVEAGDTNPYVSGLSGFGAWTDLSIVASVFRNASSFVASANDSSTSGMPNPPSLTASGGLWIATGHIDDDVVTNWVAPANYTLAASETNGSSETASSTAVAYRIESLASDDPAAFSGSGDDAWWATTVAFD